MNNLTTKSVALIQRLNNNRRWRTQLAECVKRTDIPIKALTYEQKKEIKDFYSKFGFKTINTDWHQYIFNITGEFSPKYIPEDFFHGILENTYNCRQFYGAWEDKAFMPYILDCVSFPETICCNVNGYFYDKNKELISSEEALRLVEQNGDAFAKPTLASGGGVKAHF